MGWAERLQHLLLLPWWQLEWRTQQIAAPQSQTNWWQQRKWL
jgi:hypothetical protein